jgi:hypothetical protein
MRISVANFTQFVALLDSDTAFRLPDPNSTSTEGTRSFQFDLPGLNTHAPVIIMFKVAVLADLNLQMSLNGGAPSVDLRMISPFDHLQPRSWHKIVDGNRFEPKENELQVQAIRNPQIGHILGGYMQVSDIVMLYSATTAKPGIEVDPMTDYAQFVSLPESDSAFRVSSVNSRSFSFDLPGLDKQREVIIIFKVAAYFHAHLQMLVNDNATPIIDFPLFAEDDPPAFRSWHEIVNGNIFNDTGNRLFVTASNEEEYAFMSVSDITFLYHVHTGPVIVPQPVEANGL